MHSIAFEQRTLPLETETRQPCFHFQNPVALDFDGSTSANPNGVLTGVLGNRNLEDRSQLVQKKTPVARDLFDPGCDPRTILSVIECLYPNAKRPKKARK